MGLDQYLYANKYMSNSEWRGEKVNKQFRDVVEACEASNVITKAQFPSATVQFQVGYWRKSNQIHDWFVNNCQDGNDDCKEYYVGREQLIQLRALCQRVLNNHELADELLPTSSGFFFGSTDYDEWYFGDLQETVEILDHALTLDDDYSFAYQSSW